VLLIGLLLQDLLALVFLALAVAPLLVLLSEGLRLAGAPPPGLAALGGCLVFQQLFSQLGVGALLLAFLSRHTLGLCTLLLLSYGPVLSPISA